MNKQPKQTQQTRRKIIKAFQELYKEQRIEKISIGAIMKKVHMNRGTFYEYFTDIYDLLDQVEDELLVTMSTAIENQCKNIQITEENGFNEFTKAFAQIFMTFETDLFYLISDHGDPRFRNKLKNQLRKHMIQDLDLSQSDPTIEYLITFVVSAITNLMEHWYHSNKDLSNEKFLSMVQKLVQEGILGYLQMDLKDIAVFKSHSQS